MDPTAERYSKGNYKIIDHDGLWKAQKMCNIIKKISDKEKIIKINQNSKEPKLMNKLEAAVVKLNGMKMINLDGRQMKFSM